MGDIKEAAMQAPSSNIGLWHILGNPVSGVFEINIDELMRS
ncbi:hypothetical protein ACVWWG_004716 [Bradyrhizobium sp. LB7.2]|jgi:hypothetical protein